MGGLNMVLTWMVWVSQNIFELKLPPLFKILETRYHKRKQQKNMIKPFTFSPSLCIHTQGTGCLDNVKYANRIDIFLRNKGAIFTPLLGTLSI